MLNLVKINRFFERLGRAVLKLRWVGIVLFLLLVAFSFAGIKHIRTDASSKKWFLEDDELTKTREKFEEIFGNNDFIAVHIRSEDIFTPKILKGIRDLGNELMEKVPYAEEIVSLTDFEFSFATEDGMRIKNLVPERIPESKNKLEKLRRLALSKKNLAGKFVSKDSTETWIMLRMKPYPEDWAKDYKEDPSYLVGRKVMEVVRQDKYKFLKPGTTGMPVINTEKKSYFGKETPRLMGFSLLITILILAFALRSFRGVIFPIITVAGSMIIVFGMQGWLGVEFDPMVITMPLYLGLAVAVGYSIHLFHYFKREFRRTGNRKHSVIYAVEETGWPVLFTALTTITALLSFLFVPVRPLRWVGMTAAAIVAVEYLVVIVMIPSLLSFGKDKNPDPIMENLGGTFLERSMEKLSKWILVHPKTIVMTLILSVIICIAGITRFQVSFDIEKTMGRGIPYVNRILDIGHSKIGSIYSYNLGIEFPNAGDAKSPENLKKFQTLIEEVKGFPLTKKTSSLLDIIKDMNQTLNEGKEEFYKIPESREMIAQLLLLYENAGGTEAEKWVDYDYQRLHLMTEVTEYNSKEMVRELDRIKERCSELFPEAKLMLIGSISQFTIMMDYVIWGQLKSFFIALFFIAFLLMLVFGSIKTGLIAMIPNISPALVVGGIMGFSDIPLDMMTVTIMPMLLGLAVDDTIHFTNHAQLEFSRTGCYIQSISRVFRIVGVALFMTSGVLVINFSAYMTSSATFFKNMGFLIVSGISAALIADYFVTPVLMNFFKPFGKGEIND